MWWRWLGTLGGHLTQVEGRIGWAWRSGYCGMGFQRASEEEALRIAEEDCFEPAALVTCKSFPLQWCLKLFLLFPIP